jgi:hypothetical protein
MEIPILSMVVSTASRVRILRYEGHNDFVQGSGNVVVSDPQTVADMQK